MPYKMSDAPRHTKKADTPAEKRQWRSVANKVLKSGGDEAKAIRIASGVVKKGGKAKDKKSGY